METMRRRDTEFSKGWGQLVTSLLVETVSKARKDLNPRQGNV